jgi:hypothetical protein
MLAVKLVVSAASAARVTGAAVIKAAVMQQTVKNQLMTDEDVRLVLHLLSW